MVDIKKHLLKANELLKEIQLPEAQRGVASKIIFAELINIAAEPVYNELRNEILSAYCQDAPPLADWAEAPENESAEEPE